MVKKYLVLFGMFLVGYILARNIENKVAAFGKLTNLGA